ncbi:MAG TPA: ATP-binding protein [Desulfurella acetivorans]|uniref:ATP-binding protein n=1 Tax=Desulfurella acetivorans TaxID=33002 RepID=A0A7C6A6X3_DESAE|nr:ATP-binding protein [Desulfurella acetivorans]
MFCKVKSAFLVGIEAYGVDVEIDSSKGMPMFAIVGLADNAIKESKERVRSALLNSSIPFKATRLTINLSPADVKKEGSQFDLPIAIGIAMVNGVEVSKNLDEFLFVAELSLDGKLRPVSGILPISLYAKNHNLSLIISKENSCEATLAKTNVYAFENLSEVIGFLNGTIDAQLCDTTKSFEVSGYDVDFSEIKGQHRAIRGALIAASGVHNLMLVGPPGTGKSMLAQRIPTIMPFMSEKEIIETTKIYSVAGVLKNNSVVTKRPFRSPHHTASDISLIGGGPDAKPGEISLAHNGVLFLDELPEFKRNVIEALRQPLENGYINVSRAKFTIQYPANFMLITAANPCPCGYYGSKTKKCTCSFDQIRRYRSKISGPFLDRIDLYVEMPELDYDSIQSTSSYTSAELMQSVTEAREIQRSRFLGEKISTNSRMSPRLIKKYCQLEYEAEQVLKQAMQVMHFSMRSYTKILKVARTIADLAKSDLILQSHIKEAISYRYIEN